MNKKTIIILSAIIIFLLLGAGIFWFYFKNGGTPFEEGSALSKLFPFAEKRDLENQTPGTEIPLVEREGGALIQITRNAVSGAGFGTSTVRYVDKQIGHIYESDVDGKNSKRISNTTFLKTFESEWSYNADKLVLKYFSDEDYESYLPVKMFSTFLGSGDEQSPLKGVFLPLAAKEVVVSPFEDKIFYLASEEGQTLGIVADFENKNQKNIFSMPFGEFNASWPSKKLITLLTKPSFGSEGFFYSLEPVSGKFEKIIGDIKGLTALLSSNGEMAIYSQSADKTIDTKIFDVKNKTSQDFNLTTFPQKCVWGKIYEDVLYCGTPIDLARADYPDEWYQGVVSFNDSIWMINFSTGESKILAGDTGSDVISPFLSKDEDYLFFINKKDGTLWSLRLK